LVRTDFLLRAVVAGVVGVEVRAEGQEGVPAAQKLILRHAAQLAAVQAGEALEFLSGGEAGLGSARVPRAPDGVAPDGIVRLNMFAARRRERNARGMRSLQKLLHGQAYGLGHQRRDGVADETEGVGLRAREDKPVRETLHTGGLARGERAVLRGVDEHQPVLAQVRDDGRTGPVAVLPGVAVLEARFVVGKLKFHPALAHGGGGVFALAQPGEVAQVAFAVRAGDVVGEPGRAVNLQHVHEITEGGFAPALDVVAATRQVVVGFELPAASAQRRQVAEGVAQSETGSVPAPGAVADAPVGQHFSGGLPSVALRMAAERDSRGGCAPPDPRRGPQVRHKVARHIEPHADEELAAAFLRHAQFPGILDLAVDAVAEFAGLLLHAGEVFAAGGGADAQHVFHHEHAGFEEVHVAEEFAVKQTARIVDEAALAVVCAVTLARGAETLAGRPADDDVHARNRPLFMNLVAADVSPLHLIVRGSLSRLTSAATAQRFTARYSIGENSLSPGGGEGVAQERSQPLRWKPREVGLNGVSHGNESGMALFDEVGAEGGDGFGVEINRGEHAEAGPLQAEREATAAAEQVQAGELMGGMLAVDPIRRGILFRCSSRRESALTFPRAGSLSGLTSAATGRFAIPAHASTPLQSWSSVTRSARARRMTTLMPGLRTPRSMPLR